MDDLTATFDAHVEPMSTAEHVEALTPVPVMQIATGFGAFKTLAAAHELDLFTRRQGRESGGALRRTSCVTRTRTSWLARACR